MLQNIYYLKGLLGLIGLKLLVRTHQSPPLELWMGSMPEQCG